MRHVEQSQGEQEAVEADEGGVDEAAAVEPVVVDEDWPEGEEDDAGGDEPIGGASGGDAAVVEVVGEDGDGPGGGAAAVVDFTLYMRDALDEIEGEGLRFVEGIEDEAGAGGAWGEMAAVGGEFGVVADVGEEDGAIGFGKVVVPIRGAAAGDAEDEGFLGQTLGLFGG